jgi:NAD+ kinase
MPGHSASFAGASPRRLALVVHPTRSISTPLATIERWASEHAVEVLQLPVDRDGGRRVAASGRLEAGDLLVAVGGDGTVLAALRASIAAQVPVLGVACGSLGALTAVHADRLADALDRVRTGDWTGRRLPALEIDAGDGQTWAVNDFVLVRQGAAQLVVEVSVDDELYVRLAGDGLIVATALGSTAYSMAAGGPILMPATPALVCTPLAMHGGNAPPLVVPATAAVRLTVHPGFGGFRAEIDGHPQPATARAYRLSLRDAKVTLVAFSRDGVALTGLRERQLILDSPRILARDARAAGAG